MAATWKSYRFEKSNRTSSSHNPGILVIDEMWTFTMTDCNKDKSKLWFSCTCRKTNGIFCPVKAWVIRTEVKRTTYSIYVEL